MEDNNNLTNIKEQPDAEIVAENIKQVEQIEDEEDKIQITQTLTKEDLKNVNILLINTKSNLFTLIIGIIAIAYGTINLIVMKEQASLVYDIILIILGILGILFYAFFAKKIIINKIEKTDFKDLEPLEITLTEQGFTYRFVSEPSDILPYTWELITKAEVTEKYIIIKTVSPGVFFIIKKSDITDDRFILFLKEKLGNNIKEKSQHK